MGLRQVGMWRLSDVVKMETDMGPLQKRESRKRRTNPTVRGLQTAPVKDNSK